MYQVSFSNLLMGTTYPKIFISALKILNFKKEFMEYLPL